MNVAEKKPQFYPKECTIKNPTNTDFRVKGFFFKDALVFSLLASNYSKSTSLQSDHSPLLDDTNMHLV